jgi:hypothetical protein
VDDTDWKAEARKWEQRAKANSAAAKEQERQRLASMTESERKEAEAELRGWTSAVEALGERLVRSQFLAAAAKRNADHDTEPLLEDLNLKKYIGDDGEPDAKAIAKAVERLVPAPPSGPPSFDGAGAHPQAALRACRAERGGSWSTRARSACSGGRALRRTRTVATGSPYACHRQRHPAPSHLAAPPRPAHRRLGHGMSARHHGSRAPRNPATARPSPSRGAKRMSTP